MGEIQSKDKNPVPTALWFKKISMIF